MADGIWHNLSTMTMRLLKLDVSALFLVAHFWTLLCWSPLKLELNVNGKCKHIHGERKARIVLAYPIFDSLDSWSMQKRTPCWNCSSMPYISCHVVVRRWSFMSLLSHSWRLKKWKVGASLQVPLAGFWQAAIVSMREQLLNWCCWKMAYGILKMYPVPLFDFTYIYSGVLISLWFAIKKLNSRAMFF